MTARGSRAERAFTLLLGAYPAEFRSRFEREMTLVFREQWRDASERGVGFWTEIVWDVARSAPRLRAESLRARWAGDNPIEGTRMKPMAILAVLIGAVQLVGALMEARAGWATYGSSVPVVSVLAMVLAGAMLLGAGVALLRGSRSALTWANVAAIACLGAVVLVRLTFPWMSIFSTVLAIGFPIALLVFLRVSRGAGASRGSMAS
jgi:hypothetical protein